MSVILDLGTKFTNLPTVLGQYDNAMSSAEVDLTVRGKSLELSNMENPTFQSYYDQKKSELKTLSDFFEMQCNKTRSTLFVKYKENHSRELSDREIQQYVNSEEEFLIINELYLEVREMYMKYSAIVDAFTSRGYALNNITKLRVASLEDVIL